MRLCSHALVTDCCKEAVCLSCCAELADEVDERRKMSGETMTNCFFCQKNVEKFFMLRDPF
jgi:hypothetical protein